MSRQPVGDEPVASARLRPATSADVARLAGVSRATVSHVLNDQVARFSADTVERVRSAAAELGYVRSAAGRALVMGRSDFVVLVVPYTTFTNLQDVIEVISAQIEEVGLSPVIHFSVSRAESAKSRRFQHLIETLRPAGVADLGGLSPQEVDFLAEVGCPLLAEDEQPDYNPAIGRLQAEHLHSRGYERICYAFLSDARDDPYGQQRARAVTEYCARESLPEPPYVRVPLEREGAREVLKELLPRTGGRFGVACYNDLVAIALAESAAALGLDVPGDVAFIGVEHAPVGQIISPSLTTVAANMSVSLSHIVHSLAVEFGGTPLPRPSPDQAFRVVQGEST
ncbi:LacI family DNA-binding transcriptional regulator [Actinocorallia sp. A-T 12471]|uniref:LacI family DNA-binding transcriptional regulator n=1 Tax=Actinocorallia sp. A-T 12471 TaxID=3089813 RepID=UPI0029D1541C|nr:LacI family DNA-binding transcriptional regulator [Actinocorallia sp. A-T 12471]MDX6742161.1 LacI family DNA-binding transcriptional regulator [Actinocorallia sp. A-T 12471]